MRHPIYYLTILFFTLLITACSSDSNTEDSFPEAYLQFYNGSATSPTTQILIDDELLSSSSYGDASSLFSLESGQQEIKLQWQDADGLDTLIEERTIELLTGHKTVLMMMGDFENPDITEFQFARSELEDQFYLYGLTALNNNQNYDLYVSEDGATFADAQFIMSVGYNDFQQGQYWDADDDLFAWDEGDYKLYLTLPGEQETIFESQSIGFNFSSDYILVVRNTTGANQNNLVIDIILNSSNISAYQDTQATAQYRIYNSLNQERELQVSLSGLTDEADTQFVPGGHLTEFTEVVFGDYQITVRDAVNDGLLFDNRLLTLNQGDSKSILLFEDESGSLTSLEVIDSNLPQTFEHEINIANLIPEFNELDVYFVRDDETIESAEYKMTGLDYADSRSIRLPNDYYSVVIVHEDTLGIDSLLYRSDIWNFTNDDLLMITIEPDDNSGSGYVANLLTNE